MTVGDGLGGAAAALLIGTCHTACSIMHTIVTTLNVTVASMIAIHHTIFTKPFVSLLQTDVESKTRRSTLSPQILPLEHSQPSDFTTLVVADGLGRRSCLAAGFAACAVSTLAIILVWGSVLVTVCAAFQQLVQSIIWQVTHVHRTAQHGMCTQYCTHTAVHTSTTALRSVTALPDCVHCFN